jgi:hypothetical protein
MDSGANSGPSSKKAVICKVCHGLGHEIRTCYYIFPQKVPQNSRFRSNPSVKALVQAVLSNNYRLNEEVERVKKEEKEDEEEERRRK